jgi:hypothetical protein
MPGSSLTTAATLQCPHGGTVQIVSSNLRVKGDGAPLALSGDTFTIVGCPYQIPATPPIPSPCTTVLWVVADLRAKVNGAATLSQNSTGICLSAAQVPQGQVGIVNTQQKVKSE